MSRIWTSIGVAGSGGLVYTILSPKSAFSTRLAVSRPVQRHYGSQASHWPGWSGIKHIISFGDSYTTTSFNHTFGQPNPENPFGNPAYPGVTSSNGPNWLDFLTLNYNRSYIETINLSFGGATLDYFLIAPHVHFVRSVKYQIQRWYTPKYSSQPDFFKWQADDTLFTIWVGINDIGNAARGTDSVFELVFQEYAALMDELYRSGARNFLFITVPPFYRAPKIRDNFPADEGMLHDRVLAWNKNVTSIAGNLRRVSIERTATVLDVSLIPAAQTRDFPRTVADSTSVRDLFGQATDWYTYNKEHCDYSVDRYFWLDDLHPTFRIHNLTARMVSEFLLDVPSTL
nr:acetylesterase [Quercus suber]